MTRPNSTAQTADYMYVSGDSPACTRIEANITPSSPRVQSTRPHRIVSVQKKEDVIERAVYSHIRAVRTLGRTRINTSDIANALDLNVNDVNRAVVKLKSKGVRNI